MPPPRCGGTAERDLTHDPALLRRGFRGSPPHAGPSPVQPTRRRREATRSWVWHAIGTQTTPRTSAASNTVVAYVLFMREAHFSTTIVMNSSLTSSARTVTSNENAEVGRRLNSPRGLQRRRYRLFSPRRSESPARATTAVSKDPTHRRSELMNRFTSREAMSASGQQRPYREMRIAGNWMRVGAARRLATR